MSRAFVLARFAAVAEAAMVRRRVLGWAATLLVAAAARADDASGGSCELSRLDRERTHSERCLACHDGAVGPGLAFRMRTREPGMEHPVEVAYAAAAARRPGRYVPESAIRADVPLVDGKIVCTSCHDGAATTPKHVVDPQRLCYACHNL